MTTRPNILLIICDQLRADHLGCYGNRTVRTPAIDSIAARGVAFDQFYVASPVCQPNRATLATGRMPSLHGVRINGISLSLAANTFIDMLRINDWRTALIGKGHLQNFGGVSPSLKRPAPPDGYIAPPKGFDEADKEDRGDPIYDQENAKTFAANPAHDLRRPYYGFEHVELCSQHSTRVQGHYTQWLRERRPDGDKLRGPDNQLPHDYVMPQAWRTALPEELYPTSYVVERTLAYLDDHARNAGGKPFFVQCSFPDPHHPFTPPGRYWDMYRPDDMALPPSFEYGNRPLPRSVAWALEQRESGKAVMTEQAAFAVNEREAREAMALSCGMIAMIDDAVGRVLGRLASAGLADDTIVIFTTDHGDFLGDHRLMLKGPAHFDGITHVPFIWAEPGDGRGARTSDVLSGTLDIAATLLDRARVQPYNGIQGESLLPAISGETIVRDSMVIEDDQQRSVLGHASPPRLRTIVTRRWRMSIAQGDIWGELYDLENDPHEMDNLFDDPRHRAVRAELMEKLAYRQMELADRSPLPMGRA
jgi:arylsulfatase A-like enzyme